ncbi:hypothetical protein H4R34_000410 [Dimargaris verticillata]|uniref:Uncharacterized protein n=1 Tax=Dimargaris verticillata TaxID=2761393 RepID=A0A9W8EBA5_9FUNG|nr:hypothetical protein H4R34_000410 [Dimargaris verticillata]
MRLFASLSAQERAVMCLRRTCLHIYDQHPECLTTRVLKLDEVHGQYLKLDRVQTKTWQTSTVVQDIIYFGMWQLHHFALAQVQLPTLEERLNLLCDVAYSHRNSHEALSALQNTPELPHWEEMMLLRTTRLKDYESQVNQSMLQKLNQYEQPNAKPSTSNRRKRKKSKNELLQDLLYHVVAAKSTDDLDPNIHRDFTATMFSQVHKIGNETLLEWGKSELLELNTRLNEYPWLHLVQLPEALSVEELNVMFDQKLKLAHDNFYQSLLDDHGIDAHKEFKMPTQIGDRKILPSELRKRIQNLSESSLADSAQLEVLATEYNTSYAKVQQYVNNMRYNARTNRLKQGHSTKSSAATLGATTVLTSPGPTPVKAASDADSSNPRSNSLKPKVMVFSLNSMSAEKKKVKGRGKEKGKAPADPVSDRILPTVMPTPTISPATTKAQGSPVSKQSSTPTLTDGTLASWHTDAAWGTTTATAPAMTAADLWGDSSTYLPTRTTPESCMVDTSLPLEQLQWLYMDLKAGIDAPLNIPTTPESLAMTMLSQLGVPNPLPMTDAAPLTSGAIPDGSMADPSALALETINQFLLEQFMVAYDYAPRYQ